MATLDELAARVGRLPALYRGRRRYRCAACRRLASHIVVIGSGRRRRQIYQRCFVNQ